MHPHRLTVVLLAPIVLALACSPCCEEEAVVVERPAGAYMGQAPPGLEPEMFAPGFVSTALSELNSVFSPDGDELFFAVSRGRHFGYTMFVTRLVDGAWSTPEVPAFARGISAVDMAMTADGHRLYFCSNKPRTPGGEPEEDFDIWFVERQGDGSWGEPVNPGPPLNSDQDEFYPSTTADGTIYLQSAREGGHGGRDLYRVGLVDGVFATAENLGATINTSSSEGDVLVASDESWVIFNSRTHDQDGGQSGLCIAFRSDNGEWTEPKNMGRYMKGHRSDFCPMLSPDGRYLFFSSGRLNSAFAGEDLAYETFQKNHSGPGGGLGDIYWVEVSVIDKARSDILGVNPDN